MTAAAHQLHTIVIGDEPAPWRDAGFTVDDHRLRIGNTTLDLIGGEQRGIAAIGIEAGADAIHGLTCNTSLVDAPSNAHANHVDGIDHLVVMSPAMNRTTDALARAGIEVRRERRFSVEGEARRQCFFWLGDVILELVGRDDIEAEGKAQFWGLALSCDDLDAAAGWLGDRLGPPRPALQSGRSIATIRTLELDISVPMALMTPHHQPG
jgi:hypothetical protein